MASETDDYLSLDIEEQDLAEDIRPDSTVTWSTDWTVATIVDQLRRGRFDLEPDFQRRDVWSDVKRSKFIESLLLGIPVPQVILAERRDARGRFIVLDGKQRLRSLQRFAGLDGQPLKLRGLDVLTDLNGVMYDDLRERSSFEDHASALDNQAIRAVVLRGWANESLLYLTFLRLNSNVVGLSPQELRRALHPGPFMDYTMQASSQSAAIQRFLSISKPDFRMRDAEILTRHVALSLRLDSYRGDLRRFLDETCSIYNSNWAGEAARIVAVGDRLDLAITATYDVFERNAFKRVTETGYESRKNRAVLDIMAYYFQHRDVREVALEERVRVKRQFELLSRNSDDFQAAVTSTTKSVGAVYGRLQLWGEALADVVPIAGKYLPN